MKVAFVNNSDNNAYRLCKWFRACGYESDLFITPREREILRSAPEMVDRELAEQGYPDWIRTWESKPGAAWYLRSGDMGRQIDREYDIAITSGSQGLLAAHSLSLPLAHQTLGSDITERPFDLFGLGSAPSIRGRALVVNYVLQRKVRKVFTAFVPAMRALQRLGLRHRITPQPFPEDVRGNLARVGAELKAVLTERYASYDMVALWLSRVEMNPSRTAYKGTEHFLEAFARLVASGERVRAIVGRHGFSVDEAERRISELGIREHVDWVPHMDFWRLLTHYSLPNGVFVDELDPDKGELSGGAREALSVGCPVIKTLDADMTRLLFGPDCPIRDAVDADTCEAALRELLAGGAEGLAQERQRSLAWAEQALDYGPHVERYVRELEQILLIERRL